jgi:hypothetical protein
MGLRVVVITAIAERLDRTRMGRAINLGAATVVITWEIVILLLIINMLIFTALGC